MTGIERIEHADAVARLRAHDLSLFGGDPQVLDSVSNRLGWTHLAESAYHVVSDAKAIAAEAAAEGVTDVVLLGMGGSSLASLVIGRLLGTGTPTLHVLDTVAPVTVATTLGALDPARTIYVVSSKSGGTIEPNALYAIFRAHADDSLGREAAGRRFVALTDPGSSLSDLARDEGFRITVKTQPDVGGRFSALTAFGLVPAALIGVDIDELVERAARAERRCGSAAADNPAAQLAAFMIDARSAGADKLTIVAPPPLRSFGLWVEQLVAESLGKLGTGVIPVVELADEPAGYGADRAVVVVRERSDTSLERTALRLEQEHPVLDIAIDDRYDLGAEFVRWEYAIALAGFLLGINPFDEPNVAEAKAATAAVLDGTRSAPPSQFTVDGADLTFAGATAVPASPPTSLADGLRVAIGELERGDYLAVLAYLPDDDVLLAPLTAAAPRVAQATGSAVCLERGPRYLHSTGQLHKGGPATGVFVIITTRDPRDLPVPGRPWTIGALHRAQAEGDLLTLATRGLRVIRVDLPDAGAGAVTRLARALAEASEA